HSSRLGGARRARSVQVAEGGDHQTGHNGQRDRQHNPKSDGHGFRISLSGGVDGVMSALQTISSYEEARARHRWSVPDSYNIAADVCDRHPRDKLAMIHERFDGATRRTSWGELQDDSNRFANVLTARGVGKGDRVAMLL